MTDLMLEKLPGLTFGERLAGRVASALTGNLAIRLDNAPICSFTFDDCPRSALENAGALLESLGASATFFVSGRPAIEQKDLSDPYMWGDDLPKALSKGHEIGCHTYTHPHLGRLSAGEIHAEIDANLAAIRRLLPNAELVSFAYPFGEVSITAKQIVARRFGVARGVRRGLNGRLVDLSELRTCSIDGSYFGKEKMRRIIKNAVRRRSWLVFSAHTVGLAPAEWGCSLEQFEFVVREVRSAGIEILPLRSALGRITHRAPRDQ